MQMETIKVFEAMLFAIAVSTGAYSYCFAYGVNKIKIPFSVFIFRSTVFNAMLAAALLLGSFHSQFIFRVQAQFQWTRLICLVLLSISGILELFNRKRSELYFAENRGMVKSLAFVCLFPLCTFLSAAGAAFGGISILSVLVFSGFINTFFTTLGYVIGTKTNEKIYLDFSWLSAVLFVSLGVLM